MLLLSDLPPAAADLHLALIRKVQEQIRGGGDLKIFFLKHAAGVLRDDKLRQAYADLNCSLLVCGMSLRAEGIDPASLSRPWIAVGLTELALTLKTEGHSRFYIELISSPLKDELCFKQGLELILTLADLQIPVRAGLGGACFKDLSLMPRGAPFIRQLHQCRLFEVPLYLPEPLASLPFATALPTDDSWYKLNF